MRTMVLVGPYGRCQYTSGRGVYFNPTQPYLLPFHTAGSPQLHQGGLGLCLHTSSNGELTTEVADSVTELLGLFASSSFRRALVGFPHHFPSLALVFHVGINVKVPWEGLNRGLGTQR